MQVALEVLLIMKLLAVAILYLILLHLPVAGTVVLLVTMVPPAAAAAAHHIQVLSAAQQVQLVKEMQAVIQTLVKMPVAVAVVQDK